MGIRYLIVLLAAVLTGCAAQAEPFADLRAAYIARDPVAAAAVYAPDAVVTYRYDDTPEERHIGTAAIEASFREFFAQFDPKDRLDVNFRVSAREGDTVSGVYRLRIGNAGTYFGRFEVTFAADGSFASDLSTSAKIADFEEAPGPVLLEPEDENLDRDFYAGFAGRYQLTNECALVVTRSVVRLFVRNSCSNEWRGLSRQSGRKWTAGDRIISDKHEIAYSFAPLRDGISPSLEITGDGVVQTARRISKYRTEPVSFTSADGTKLAGTIYSPVDFTKPRPASVMLHGSGPQDRDGYASIIAVIADELATNGRVVLAYDKRGSGASEGDADRATFDVLAQDAAAAMEVLAKQSEVDASKIGLAGSSQAGWVAAKVVASGANPADVLLLGAAGAATSVAEQNLYNTEVRARCAGLSEPDIRLALDQQRAFFAFIADPEKADVLDELTAKASTRPVLTDWIFPDSRSTDRNLGAWYVVLDPAFDPLPIWRGYNGKALFLFSEWDDATHTDVALERLKPTRARTRLLQNAQHLGLEANNICTAELPELQGFSPQLFTAIADFAK